MTVELSLGDQLLLLSYDDETGKPLIPLKNIDYGLAGAELLEHSFAGRLAIDQQRLRVTGDPGRDPVLTQIDTKAAHTPGWWVYHLADPHRREHALSQLVTAGILEEHPHRFRRATYPEIDTTAEKQLVEHLREVVGGQAEPDKRSVALIGLAHACGLDKHLFPSLNRRRLAELTEGDWCGHAVQNIIDAMNVAVLSAVTGGFVSSTASAIPAT